MPKVDKIDNLEEMHTTKKFGQPLKPSEFVEQLNAIEVDIVHAPTVEQFRQTISVFLGNTWGDTINWDFEEAETDRIIDQLFKFELLPTAMETINLTFAINGMDMIDTTHLIRHRLFSFSAQCHGDRDMRDDRIMVKPSIMQHPEFFERYQSITNEARKLYVDMMDSGEIHGLDARTIMPRNFEHFYFARATIKDWIGYCNMRKDENIQTTVDNIIALKVWKRISEVYPFLAHLVDFDKPDEFYVRQSKKGKTNIFPPAKKNDLFDWVPEQFFHPLGRDEFPGGEVFLELRDKLKAEIQEIVDNHKAIK